jgi:hypothetical protein
MFRTDLLSIIRSLNTVHTAQQYAFVMLVTLTCWLSVSKYRRYSPTTLVSMCSKRVLKNTNDFVELCCLCNALLKRLFFKRPSPFDINLWRIWNFGKAFVKDVLSRYSKWGVACLAKKTAKAGRRSVQQTRTFHGTLYGMLDAGNIHKLNVGIFCIHKDATSDLQGKEMHIYTVPEWLVSLYVFRL